MTGLKSALVALILWAVHFFGAYGLMLAFPDAAFVRWATLALGVACLALLALTARHAPKKGAARPAQVLAAIAIVWQSIVGLF